MKKLLAILVLSLLWCNTSFASELKNLLETGFKLKTTNLTDDGSALIYNLVKKGVIGEQIRTCVWSFEKMKIVICFAP